MIHIVRILFLNIVFLFAFSSAFAQSFAGAIRNEDGQPLVGASVMLKATDGSIVTYCIAEENGAYNLNVPKEKNPVQVVVSFIGYKKKIFPFSELRKDMIIILAEEAFLIKEVKVAAQRIRSSGDTLTYSVSAFKQEQDRTLANVIAKMPGLEVKADGQIAYQGKEISKFYIEGLDLMGAYYGVANQNLSADKVLNVQVLENHQAIKSLRGISFSEEAALNIVLKDDAKASLANSADLGLGYGDELLHDCRFMSMLFKKKFQTLMMYKNNNTGTHLDDEVLDIDAILKNRGENESGIISMVKADVPDLDENRYTFNNSHLIAGNWLWKTGKDSELRIQVNGLIEKDDLQSFSSTKYLTFTDLPIVTEEQKITNTYNEWKGEVNYQYNGSKTYIKNNLKGFIDFDKSVGSMLYNNQTIGMLLKPHRRSLSENFLLSHKTVNSNVFNIESYLLYNYFPGKILTINGMAERLNLGFFSSQNKFEYKLKIGKHYLDNEIGINYDSQSMGIVLNDDVKPSSTYTLLRGYWSPSISFLFGNHRVDAKLKFSYARQTYRTSTNHFWLDPSLKWNWKASAMSEFSADINFANFPLMSKSIYGTPIFTDYRTVTSNRGVPDTRQILSIASIYKYSNPILGLFFHIRQIYSNSTNNILYQSNLENSIYSLTATDKAYNMQTIGLSARISKTFAWAKTLIGLGVTRNTTNYKLLLDGTINNARMNITLVGLNCSFRPVQPLSIEGKSSMNISQQKNLSHENLSSGAIFDYAHHLNFYILPAKGWIVSVKNAVFHANEDEIDTNYFLDLALTYKSKHWELSLLANNIIGTSQFERRILRDTIELYSVTRLRPREFMVKWSMDF